MRAHHPALQIPGDVGPRVREEDADLAEARGGDVSFEEHGGVGANQPDILQPYFFTRPAASNICRGLCVISCSVTTYCVTVTVSQTRIHLRKIFSRRSVV